MKKLNTAIPSMTGSPEYVQEQGSANANKVWAAMAEMFGNTFLNQFGETPPSVWRLQIDRLADNEVRRGLNNIAEANLSFPPNLSQFIAACKRLSAESTGYWNAPKLPDLREPGKMSYAEWKAKHDAEAKQ